VNVLHFDCFSGAAGDMLLAALLDAGVPEAAVRESLDALHLDGWTLTICEVRRAGLRAARVEVAITEEQVARRLDDVLEVLDRAPLADGVRDRAAAAFRVLAEAEARVHGAPVEEVHFHETGALDALIDVVGVAAAVEHLNPARITASAIATGSGTIETAHGRLPVPAPAVVEVLREIPLVGRGEHELVTPTGAALLRTVCDDFGTFPDMVVERAGYGAGSYDDPGAPNVVRAVVGRSVTESAQSVVLLETNLDDLSPEITPYVLDLLLHAGAIDAWVTPALMKKGRPGHVLSVMVDHSHRAHLTEIIFRETSTLGVRERTVARTTLARELLEVEVEGVCVRVKIGRMGDEVVNIAPEHDDARAAAVRLGMPLKEVYERALTVARALF
jgi:pyridinium-3,5-bisthiocarboxylic acid mononucleotide nickel chelatase